MFFRVFIMTDFAVQFSSCYGLMLILQRFGLLLTRFLISLNCIDVCMRNIWLSLFVNFCL
ncbi:hypothetical protein Hanom_Chr07g00651951 [Helianthus anomalus]